MYVFRRMDRYRSMDRGATTLGGGGREKTACIPVGKASELIEDEPIWFTTKSYVV